jgi:hypothetical protein
VDYLFGLARNESVRNAGETRSRSPPDNGYVTRGMAAWSLVGSNATRFGWGFGQRRHRLTRRPRQESGRLHLGTPLPRPQPVDRGMPDRHPQVVQGRQERLALSHLAGWPSTATPASEEIRTLCEFLSTPPTSLETQRSAQSSNLGVHCGSSGQFSPRTMPFRGCWSFARPPPGS